MHHKILENIIDHIEAVLNKPIKVIQVPQKQNYHYGLEKDHLLVNNKNNLINNNRAILNNNGPKIVHISNRK